MSFLSQPYPLEDLSARKFLIAFLTSLLVCSILFVLRPFGLSSLPQDESLLLISGYGITSFLVLLFDQFVIPALFSTIFMEAKWTVGKNIIYILFCVLTLGFANLIYTNIILSPFDNDSIRIFPFLFILLMVAVLPVTINVVVKQLLLLKRNLAAAKNISLKMHHKKRLDATPDLQVTIRAENKKGNLTIVALDILFITASDGNVDIHYLEDGIEKNKIIRTTLKSAKEDLRNQNAFYRCQRNWIVNLDHVESVSGNAQGFRLLLNKSETQIPVSRNLNLELTARLAK